RFLAGIGVRVLPAARGQTEAARHVRSVGRLDFDNLSAEVRQDLRALGARPDVGQIEDTDPFERWTLCLAAHATDSAARTCALCSPRAGATASLCDVPSGANGRPGTSIQRSPIRI